MGENKNSIWALPLIGGILALIGLLTPAASYSSYYNTMQFWMWGLMSVRLYDYYEGYLTVTQFTESPVEIGLSIISTVIILVSAILLISKANSSRKNGVSGVGWLSPSILMMLGTIIWMVGLEIYSQIYSGLSFWTYIDAGFGVIGPFLGAGLSIVGYGVSKMSSKRTQEMIIPMKQGFTSPHISINAAHSFRFCPQCGEKRQQADQHFCINCGFDLKSFPASSEKKEI